MRRLLPILLLSLSGCAASVKPDCSAPTADALDSVVRIATLDGASASGVIVGPNRVLTAAHAVEGDIVALVGLNETFYEAVVLAVDADTDLALLEVDTAGIKPVQVSQSKLNEFESVWAVGYPRAMARNTTRGEFRDVQDGRLYTTAYIDSGNSGGGLLRCNAGSYELAGVVHGFVALVENDEYRNIGDSTSVPADTILTFMNASEQRLANNL